MDLYLTVWTSYFEMYILSGYACLSKFGNCYQYREICLYKNKQKTMLIWCLKQVKNFTLKYPMDVSVEVHKIIKCAIYIQYSFFSTSGGGVDDVLVRLSLIEQIIKDVYLMSILFSLINPQTFRESYMSLFNVSRIISNMYAYPLI